MKHIRNLIVKWGVCPYCKKAGEFWTGNCPNCRKPVRFEDILEDE